jgi:hypothetical protein
MDGHTGAEEKASKDRYFVSSGGRPEREVGRLEYISTERSAGFKSKFDDDSVATSSFSSGNGESHVAGRIVHANGRALSRGPAADLDTEQGPMQRSDDLSR